MQSCLILNSTTFGLPLSRQPPPGWCTTSTPRPPCCFTPGPWGSLGGRGLEGLLRACSPLLVAVTFLVVCVLFGHSSTRPLNLSSSRSFVPSSIRSSSFFPFGAVSGIVSPLLLLRHRQSFQSPSSQSHHITAAVRECVCALSSPVLWSLSIVF
jgi:hypothetical protein